MILILLFLVEWSNKILNTYINSYQNERKKIQVWANPNWVLILFRYARHNKKTPRRHCNRDGLHVCPERTPESVASHTHPHLFISTWLLSTIENGLLRQTDETNGSKGLNCFRNFYNDMPMLYEGCCLTMESEVRWKFKWGCWPCMGAMREF